MRHRSRPATGNHPDSVRGVEAGSKLYDTDTAAWAEAQAALLRAGQWDDIDAEHVAEEIEDVSKSERRELRSRMVVLLAHLAKWHVQMTQRSRSWESTIAEQRVQVDSIIDESPSLRSSLGDLVHSAWSRSTMLAAKQTGLARETFPERCPWSLDQVLDIDFLPAEVEER